jgi:PBP1b-binding outer membrane lipoprotein LpoB
MVDPRTRTAIGKQVGADLMLYGDIISIVKSVGRKQDVYYKINLELADLKTGLIEWSEEKEIRKQAKKALIGW